MLSRLSFMLKFWFLYEMHKRVHTKCLNIFLQKVWWILWNLRFKKLDSLHCMSHWVLFWHYFKCVRTVSLKLLKLWWEIDFEVHIMQNRIFLEQEHWEKEKKDLSCLSWKLRLLQKQSQMFGVSVLFFCDCEWNLHKMSSQLQRMRSNSNLKVSWMSEGLLVD